MSTFEIQTKIDSAIRILKIAEKQAEVYDEPVEIAYSGGKDSDVLLQLAKESGIKFIAIYKNTTIDPPGTIQHVRENNVKIQQPKLSFFDIIKQKGFPSMFRRFCCAELKEYKINNVCALGVRAAESSKRKKRYKTFEECRVFSKKEKVKQYYPIWDWTLSDVKDFIKSRNIKLAPVYYTDSGDIDFSRRLGCQGCPLKNDRGVADFKKNIPLLKAWLRAGVNYTHTHTLAKFDGDAFKAFVCNVFFKSYEDFKTAISNNLFSENYDCKKYLENYFNTKFNF